MMLASLAVAALSAAATPQDTANIALSTSIVQRIGDAIWPGWSTTPFQIDLLTQDGPVLVNVPKPFTPPKFPRDLEATITLETGPIIVIGEPRYTQSQTPVRWSVTLLHEHFHEWQYSWPPYNTAARALGLARGDSGGMWMLNYPFPYTDARVDAAYAQMSARLAEALESIRSPRFNGALAAYLQARANFKSVLAPDDYKYFTFQCWQEGTARYTEIAVAQRAAYAHQADPAFLTDAQAAALMDDANRTYAGVLKRLRTIPLQEDKRVDFYAVGAGEALLLDQIAPGWHERYLDPRMDLSVYFPAQIMRSST
jgi:hypothetical protein